MGTEPADEFGRSVDDLGEFFTPEEADALKQLASIDDLLTDEERAKLTADLREIAACRRRALEASAHWQMP
jgi:hypothetical protein